jgi:DNA-binding MarR family transcriptional regulator
MLEQKIESRIKEKTGLCLNDFYLLYYLGESDHQKMKIQDACQEIQMSQSALSRLVQRLEELCRKPLTVSTHDQGLLCFIVLFRF